MNRRHDAQITSERYLRPRLAIELLGAAAMVLLTCRLAAAEPFQAAAGPAFPRLPAAPATPPPMTPPVVPMMVPVVPMTPPAAPAMAMPAVVFPPARSAAMETIARQSDDKIRQGIDLADRGATFAARAEFIAALRLLAQGLDGDEATSRHSQALGAALTAMKEAQDFLPAAGKVEGELDLPAIVAGHRTPVLKNVPPQRLQAMLAVKQYFTFAQEQLRTAVGSEVSGSMALASLGKLHAAVAGQSNPEIVLSEAKAITFYQAALLASPRNYMAANDLGVLLAHKSDYVAARGALEHSVNVCRCSENLKNLSIVYRQIGDLRSAELAARDAETAKVAEIARLKAGNRLGGGAVQWVGPEAMAKPSDQWSDLSTRPATAAQNRPAAAPAVGQTPAPFGPPAMR